MSLLVTLIVGLIVLGILVWGEEYLAGILPTNLVRLIQALTIILGALLIASRAGVL
jgi:hypothetical protein